MKMLIDYHLNEFYKVKITKKWIGLCIIFSFLFVFVACSKEEEGNESILLSDAIEQYSIWFHVEGNPVEPTEESSIVQVFVFDKDELTVYDLTSIDLHVSEVLEFSDAEIVSHVEEKLTEEDDNYVEEDGRTFTIDIHQEAAGEETYAMTVDVRDEVLITLLDEPISTHISDTIYIGMALDHEPSAEEKDVFMTRVEEENIVLEFDQPDTNKDYVTVNEWMERQKQPGLEGQNLQELDEEMDEEIFNEPGADIYAQSCLACHGENLEGGIGPDLSLVGDRFSKEEIIDIAINGRGTMPGDTVQNEEDVEVLAEWLSEYMKK